VVKLHPSNVHQLGSISSDKLDTAYVRPACRRLLLDYGTLAYLTLNMHII
jgi:hypothetical protein